MLLQIWTAVSAWNVIVQGALGSALFWFLLKGFQWLVASAQKTAETRNLKSRWYRLLQEYIYTKYTAGSGLIYYSQGHFITFSYVLKFFVTGMVYLSIALIIGGMSRLGMTIGLVGALYYFFKALAWLSSKKSWGSGTPLERLNRIRDLEKMLFGKIHEDTQGWLSQVEAAEALSKAPQPIEETEKQNEDGADPGTMNPAGGH